MSKSPEALPVNNAQANDKTKSRSRTPDKKSSKRRRSRSSSSSSSSSVGYRRNYNRRSGGGGGNYRRDDRRDDRGRDGRDGERNRVHVSNIDETVSERDIEDSFKQFGPIEEIWLATYAPFYSFIRFKDSIDAEEAARSMNQRFIRNCKVKATIALPRRRPGDPPPRRNYGFGGDRRSPVRYGGRDRFRQSRSPRRRSRSPPPRRRRSPSSRSSSSRSRSK